MTRIAAVAVLALALMACAQWKEAGHEVKDGSREAGHAIRDTAKDVGHGAVEAAKELGTATRDAVREVRKDLKKKDEDD
jgi:gas vesicle protein